MSYGYSGPPCPAPFNLAAHVLAAGARTPGKLALDWIGRARWTFEELTADILGTATGLARLTAPGDMILLRLGNTPDFPIAYLAALAADRVPIPTSAALTEAEVTTMTQGLPITLTLRDPEVACPDHLKQLDIESLRALRAEPPAPFTQGDPERLGYVVFTSGTSGTARAVAHAHRAIWARQMMMDGWYGLKPDDRVLHAGAFNWTYTLGTGLMDPWTRGATALIPPPGTAPADLPALLAETGATIFAAAPGVYRQALRGPVPALPALRHGLSAGEKLPEATRAAWQEATGTPIFEAFGMSECSTFISGSPTRPAAPGTLGAPQPGRAVAILGPDGQVPPGTQGTIAVHRSDPGLMLGYLNAPEETAARMQGDWFLTGDTGTEDQKGFIRFDARADDMMNAGGYRVSPLEVEAALSGAPGVSAVACTEVQVKSDASVIAAFYTAAHALDESILRAYAERKLARYKHPRLYVHVSALPTGANGKILRRALREEWKARN
ncbi:MAG: class I adenylate-forming enzyme family protein [Pseudomonadota bacterium]